MHQLGEHPAPAMRRQHADSRDSCARNGTAWDGQLERIRGGATDDLAVLARRQHSVERHERKETRPRDIAWRTEVVTDPPDRVERLITVAGTTDVNDHQPIFS